MGLPTGRGPSFIVTLAGMLAFRGVLIGITNGTTVSPPAPPCRRLVRATSPTRGALPSAWSGCWAFVAGSGVAVCAVSRSRAIFPLHQHPWWDVRHWLLMIVSRLALE